MDMYLPSFACFKKEQLNSLAELSKRLATAATSFDFARCSNELRAITNPN